MENFNFKKLNIEGLFKISSFFVEDDRGFFLKNYEKTIFKKNGIETDVCETFESYSHKGVIRGLHFQTENPQSKIVRCVNGEIFDIAVDLRKDSPTLGKWCGEYLNDVNHEALFIPKGFAHGFLTLTEGCLVTYVCSGTYSKGTDSGIRWDDKDISIDWPTQKLDCSVTISERDLSLMSYKEFLKTGGLE